MKLLYANIGGATGYTNAMAWFQDQITADLPCTFAVNECGNDITTRNLQPYFKFEEKKGRVCLHDFDCSRILASDNSIDTECVFTKVKFKIHNTMNSTLRECWFIATYKPNEMNKNDFVTNTTKLIKKLQKNGPKHFVIVGDLNMTPEDIEFHQLLFSINAIKIGKFMHKHRKSTNPREIDFVITNLEPELIEAESVGSFETINTSDNMLGHKAIMIKLGKWNCGEE